MNISRSTQLGLRFTDDGSKVEFMKIMKSYLDTRLSSFNGAWKFTEQLANNSNKGEVIPIEKAMQIYDTNKHEYDELLLIPNRPSQWLIDTVTHRTDYDNLFLVNEGERKYFLIRESVYQAAGLIHIGDGFTANIFNKMKFGSYCYLMGRNRMVRFICGNGAIKGIYYDSEKKNAFEFGLDFESGEHYAPIDCVREFSEIMQLMIFIELGDIEVTILQSGRNNNLPKNKGKITNTDKNTVYVVDSSWNKLIIRTDGFAVRGHFRLQPCGINHAERKLIWIDAFEKHGYKRQPRAKIIHE